MKYEQMKRKIVLVVYLSLLMTVFQSCLQEPINVATQDEKDWDNIQAVENQSGCIASIPLYKEFIKEHPQSWKFDNAQLDLAMCYGQVARADSAILIIEEISSQSSLYEKSQLAKADIIYGDLKYFEFSDALQAYRDFRVMFPNSQNYAEALYGEGQSFYKMTTSSMRQQSSYYDSAYSTFQIIVEEYENSASYPDAEYRQAWCRLQQSDHQGVIKEFSEFLQHHPNDPRADAATYWLAESLAKTGDPCGAIATLNEFTDLYPKSDYTSKVNNNINSLLCQGN